jgi:hypothetical protein
MMLNVGSEYVYLPPLRLQSSKVLENATSEIGAMRTAITATKTATTKKSGSYRDVRIRNANDIIPLYGVPQPRLWLLQKSGWISVDIVKYC